MGVVSGFQPILGLLVETQHNVTQSHPQPRVGSPDIPQSLSGQFHGQFASGDRTLGQFPGQVPQSVSARPPGKAIPYAGMGTRTVDVAVRSHP